MPSRLQMKVTSQTGEDISQWINLESTLWDREDNKETMSKIENMLENIIHIGDAWKCVGISFQMVNGQGPIVHYRLRED